MSWGEDLDPKSARSYVYYLVRFLDWAKSRGYWSSAQAMLADCAKLSEKERFKHLDILKRYVKASV